MCSMEISRFPDSLILKIFAYLPFQDLTRCSAVCKRWHNIAKDTSLNKAICINIGISAGKLLKLVLYHGSPKVKYLTVCGRRSNVILSSSFSVIKNKCPNLQFLELTGFYISEHFDNLPNTLTCLSLPLCFVYRGISMLPSNANLSCLNLSSIHMITSEDMPYINKLRSLTELFLSNCKRINDGGLELLKDILPQLGVLDVEGTDISNFGVKMLLETCSSINYLYIGHNEISNQSILLCKENLKLSLKEICIQNTTIKSDTVKTICRSDPLFSNVRNTFYRSRKKTICCVCFHFRHYKRLIL